MMLLMMMMMMVMIVVIVVMLLATRDGFEFQSASISPSRLERDADMSLRGLAADVSIIAYAATNDDDDDVVDAERYQYRMTRLVGCILGEHQMLPALHPPRRPSPICTPRSRRAAKRPLVVTVPGQFSFFFDKRPPI